MSVCKRCHVSGRVQGVFYRASARQQAAVLGVTGYARNLDDGRVEVLACGEEGGVNALIEWLAEGPRHAQVEDVEVQVMEGLEPPSSFTID